METINLICTRCAHFTPFAGGCKAFPDGIPEAILSSNKHDKPIEGQENHLVFTTKQVKGN